jgi:hypothetical protein
MRSQSSPAPARALTFTWIKLITRRRIAHRRDPAKPRAINRFSHVSPQAGGKGCSALLLAGSDLVGSMQGKLVERVQIPVKHGAIGQSFPALARNYGTAALTQERLPVFLFEFRA